MTARPWMPMYWGDYLADTAHLSTLENGAYLLLIGHYWQNQGLPTEEARLARIARLTLTQWRKVKPSIQEFFSDDWKHKRIEHELTECARISAAGRAGGIASGKARRLAKEEQNQLQDRTTVERSSNDQATKCEALQLQPQLQKKEKKDNSLLRERFEELKRGYPKRKGGQGYSVAEKIFEREIKNGIDPQIIIGAARQFGEAEIEKVGTEFIPMMETWMRKRMWLEFKPPDREAQARLEADMEARGYRWVDEKWTLTKVLAEQTA